MHECNDGPPEHILDVPVLQIFGKEAFEVVRSAPRVAEQLVRGRAEQVVAVPVSQSLEGVVDVVVWSHKSACNNGPTSN